MTIIMITISERKQAWNWDENSDDIPESVILKATYGDISVVG